jgi:hypothetical protein
MSALYIVCDGTEIDAVQCAGLQTIFISASPFTAGVGGKDPLVPHENENEDIVSTAYEAEETENYDQESYEVEQTADEKSYDVEQYALRKQRTMITNHTRPYPGTFAFRFVVRTPPVDANDKV